MLNVAGRVPKKNGFRGGRERESHSDKRFFWETQDIQQRAARSRVTHNRMVLLAVENEVAPRAARFVRDASGADKKDSGLSPLPLSP